MTFIFFFDSGFVLTSLAHKLYFVLAFNCISSVISLLFLFVHPYIGMVHYKQPLIIKFQFIYLAVWVIMKLNSCPLF